ncbi:hypothetical protein L917_20916 [Phytophthora nicotianae]|uniref:Uncharacterized protein n=1 Tax=Phytophthora nicotianae TaxID=4792 RepID=W2JZ93_PHYNI|nr:hypothetical protein L917_20916 [Phytophthora nicotianae]
MKAGFTEEEITESVDRSSSPISRTTLKRYFTARREGRGLVLQRPGPAPKLPAQCEENIVTRIAVMQRHMVPVQPWKVLEANYRQQDD